jgi:cytochrome c-type biogenesis protein CcmH
MRAPAILLMFLALAGPVLAADAPLSFDDPAQAQRYHALLAELRCLVCQNQSLEDSHADLAQDLRGEVHEMILQGRSDADILAFMVQRYGDFVLYRPPVRDDTWLLWFGPFAVLLAGAGAALVYSRARSRRAAAPLSDAEQERVRQLLRWPDREQDP